ncbi:IncN plasmid KikA protein [Salmonella enterica]|nr:IncN plasmid KikA protein [Salmonella enterica]
MRNKACISLVAVLSLTYFPSSQASDPCLTITCMAPKVDSSYGDLSGNSAKCDPAISDFYNIQKFGHHGFKAGATADARRAFLNECPDNGAGGSNQNLVNQIIDKFGRVR